MALPHRMGSVTAPTIRRVPAATDEHLDREACVEHGLPPNELAPDA
jgi:hypothetical protein